MGLPIPPGATTLQLRPVSDVVIDPAMRIAVVVGMMIAACGSPGTGGDDTVLPDGGDQTSTCTNYTPPALPDSQLVWHDAVALAAIDALTHFSVSGDSTFNSAGKITRFTHDETGTANDFTVDFTYDSAGRLTRRTFDASGATLDTTDDFTYTSAGKLSRWDHQADGATLDTTDDFTYTSAGKLSRWDHQADGATNDVTDDYTYTSHDLISRFTHQAAGTADDLTEDYSYDADGRLTHWHLDRSVGQDVDSTFTYGVCQH